MNKLILSTLALFSLVAGCAVPPEEDLDADDLEEDIEESEDAITGFFGNGSTTGSNVPSSCTSVQIVNPEWSGGQMYVNIPGSCLANNATLMMYVSGSSTSYGPYVMTPNDAGTRLRTAYLGPSIMPAGSCRTLQATNPDGTQSNLVSYCR